jgi:hypothetical protein
MSSPSPPPPTPPSSPLLVSGTLPSSSSTHFLALRCPCHPLAVKVAQEFYQTCNHLLVGRVLHGYRCIHDRDNADDDDEEEEDDDTNGNINSGYLLRAGDVRASTIRNRLLHASGRDAATESVQAVLDGEANLEHFYVPPCEHGKPYGVSVWIDESRRRIAVRGDRLQLSPSPRDGSGKAGDIIAAASAATTKQISVALISEALRFKAKTERARVVQAVLNKWVVEAEDGT